MWYNKKQEYQLKLTIILRMRMIMMMTLIKNMKKLSINKTKTISQSMLHQLLIKTKVNYKQ